MEYRDWERRRVVETDESSATLLEDEVEADFHVPNLGYDENVSKHITDLRAELQKHGLQLCDVTPKKRDRFNLPSEVPEDSPILQAEGIRCAVRSPRLPKRSFGFGRQSRRRRSAGRGPASASLRPFFQFPPGCEKAVHFRDVLERLRIVQAHEGWRHDGGIVVHSFALCLGELL